MDKARAELGRDLAHAVRTGPFSAVLHLAIEDRGLRLEEIQERLAIAGVRISLTMLNHWRRGRSQPERPESIRAVHLLEGILSLPAQSLTAQLGPRRPRGRWPAQLPGMLDVDRLFANTSVISMIKELNSWMYHELTRVSMHDVYLVGANRQEIGLVCRQVMRANIDRVSRSVGIFHSDDLQAPITISALRNCRIGRVRDEPGTGAIAAEIVFDRVLSQGETVVVEYEFRVDSAHFTDHFYRGFSVPIGEYLLQIQFDAEAVPAKCYRFEKHSISAPEQGVREVWIGSTQGAHLLACDVPPGVVGMRWEWQ
ncbi:hypothetical protein Rhe02_64950 [Rhizocola hellebori]|uniref:Uncharacterized protein n=1 Tax=Rhizocola hellebori TaxID=1392758 RepID=A0A8J3VJX5_9ACTN|nr:hypothetical protein [Rhizocola hellebori]GIH08428.1 hypothetical protein Rhe02_64950 [Rhizocola hellebori]